MKKSAIKKKKRINMVVVSLIIVFLLLILCLSVQFFDDSRGNVVNAATIECVKNSDCIIAKGSCCSCENGGAPKCIPKNQLGEYAKTLESCSKEGSCMGLDCGKISCGCVDNRCVGSSL